jgi:hypothetical protein
VPFLAKPFSAESLLSAVDAALGPDTTEPAPRSVLGPSRPDAPDSPAEPESADPVVNLMEAGPRH